MKTASGWRRSSSVAGGTASAGNIARVSTADSDAGGSHHSSAAPFKSFAPALSSGAPALSAGSNQENAVVFCGRLRTIVAYDRVEIPFSTHAAISIRRLSCEKCAGLSEPL